MTTYELSDDTTVEAGLGFLLGHFQEPRWPRTISTRTTEGRQIKVMNREEALARFKQAKLLDCRINAYPHREDWAIELLGQAPNFIFIDEDKSNFSTEQALDMTLRRTLKNIKQKLDNNTQPTVLWSGGGYNILQPVEAFVLGQESLFTDLVKYPDTEFLRFAERYLSNNKSDPAHNPSIKSCMLRVPGSYNSKLVNFDARGEGISSPPPGTQVRILQRWNGIKPSIRPLLPEFYIYLTDAKIKEIRRCRKAEKSRVKLSCSYILDSADKTPIYWIETLLQTPIPNHRKYATWRILAPYLINIRKLSYEDSFNTIKEWLVKCSSKKRLNFNAKTRIQQSIDRVGNFRPISLDHLKLENKYLYDLIKKQEGK